MTDDLKTNYQQGGFHGSLDFGRRAALIIIDVVRAYLDPACSLYAGAMAQQALMSNIRLRAAAEKAGVPVVFTAVTYAEDGRNGGLFFKKVPALKAFLPGSPFAEFPQDLQPDPGDILVTKQYASAFFGTSLASTLHAMGVDTVFLTGYSTSGCVRASTLDALQYGFIPFVIRDACADRADGPHESNLFDLQAKYAEVISEDQAIALFGRQT